MELLSHLSISADELRQLRQLKNLVPNKQQQQQQKGGKNSRRRAGSVGDNNNGDTNDNIITTTAEAAAALAAGSGSGSGHLGLRDALLRENNALRQKSSLAGGGSTAGRGSSSSSSSSALAQNSSISSAGTRSNPNSSHDHHNNNREQQQQQQQPQEDQIAVEISGNQQKKMNDADFIINHTDLCDRSLIQCLPQCHKCKIFLNPEDFLHSGKHRKCSCCHSNPAVAGCSLCNSSSACERCLPLFCGRNFYDILKMERDAPETTAEHQKNKMLRDLEVGMVDYDGLSDSRFDLVGALSTGKMPPPSSSSSSSSQGALKNNASFGAGGGGNSSFTPHQNTSFPSAPSASAAATAAAGGTGTGGEKGGDGEKKDGGGEKKKEEGDEKNQEEERDVPSLARAEFLSTISEEVKKQLQVIHVPTFNNNNNNNNDLDHSVNQQDVKLQKRRQIITACWVLSDASIRSKYDLGGELYLLNYLQATAIPFGTRMKSTALWSTIFLMSWCLFAFLIMISLRLDRVIDEHNWFITFSPLILVGFTITCLATVFACSEFSFGGLDGDIENENDENNNKEGDSGGGGKKKKGGGGLATTIRSLKNSKAVRSTSIIALQIPLIAFIVMLALKLDHYPLFKDTHWTIIGIPAFVFLFFFGIFHFKITCNFFTFWWEYVFGAIISFAPLATVLLITLRWDHFIKGDSITVIVPSFNVTNTTTTTSTTLATPAVSTTTTAAPFLSTTSSSSGTSTMSATTTTTTTTTSASPETPNVIIQYHLLITWHTGMIGIYLSCLCSSLSVLLKQIYLACCAQKLVGGRNDEESRSRTSSLMDSVDNSTTPLLHHAADDNNHSIPNSNIHHNNHNNQATRGRSYSQANQSEAASFADHDALQIAAKAVLDANTLAAHTAAAAAEEVEGEGYEPPLHTSFTGVGEGGGGGNNNHNNEQHHAENDDDNLHKHSSVSFLSNDSLTARNTRKSRHSFRLGAGGAAAGSDRLAVTKKSLTTVSAMISFFSNFDGDSLTKIIADATRENTVIEQGLDTFWCWGGRGVLVSAYVIKDLLLAATAFLVAERLDGNFSKEKWSVILSPLLFLFLCLGLLSTLFQYLVICVFCLAKSDAEAIERVAGFFNKFRKKADEEKSKGKVGQRRETVSGRAKSLDEQKRRFDAEI